MTNVQEVLDLQRHIEGTLLSRMAEIEKQLQLSAAHDSTPNLDKVTKEFNEFKKFVSTMFTLMNSQINSLTSYVESLDNQQRRNALLFNGSGISESDNEDCAAVVLDIITSRLKISDIQASSLYVCHRLGAKKDNVNRPILVCFTDIHTRNLVWKSKKLLKSSSIVISEFLTRSRQGIFTKARKHFGVTRCWSQDGNIFVKPLNSERKRITSMQDLDQLIAKFPILDITTIPQRATSRSGRARSSSRPPATVAAPEPTLTRRNAAAKGKTSKYQ